MKERKTLFSAGDAPEFGERIKFAARGGQIQFFGKPDFFGNGGVNEFVQIFVAEQREHRAGFGCVRADVAADKLIGMRQKFLQSKPFGENKVRAREKASWICYAVGGLAAGLVRTQPVWLAS